jgi:hypothetical protein
MSERWDDRGDRRSRTDSGSLVLGLLLILAGGAFLVSNVTGFDVGTYGWPIFIIAPGLFLLVLGLAIPSEGGLGAAIPGGLLASLGLLLAFQDATDTYASWSYAWALVAPGSVGVTLLLFGLTHRRMDLITSGLQTAAVGLGLFIGFGLFFENVIGLDEAHPNTIMRDSLPFLAVAMGIVIVLLNLLPRRHDKESAPTPPTPPQS